MEYTSIEFIFGVLVLIVVIAGLVRFFVNRYYLPPKLTPRAEKPAEKETEKQLARLEKIRLKQEEEEAKKRAQLEKAKQEVRLAKAQEKEQKIQEELAQKQEELEKQQILTKTLASKVEEPQPVSLIDRLKRGISKTRDNLIHGIGNVVLGKKEISEEVLAELEEVLIGADIGPETTYRILDVITAKMERKELKDPQILQETVKQEIVSIMNKTYTSKAAPDQKPLVLMFVGVNGVGKTTTIGKMAAQYQGQGKKVLMGAGDTFRAAAIEQLAEWSKRAGCDIVMKAPDSDPSAVMYETVQKAVAENYDVVLCDTAGRLHTKHNLMEELKKMVRVMKKVVPDAPHEVFLVLDATTGQNAIFQTREFRKSAELTGLIITKLDGTAKGGVVIGIVNEFDVPVRYIGVGEGIEDLRPFNAEEFSTSLFD